MDGMSDDRFADLRWEMNMDKLETIVYMMNKEQLNELEALISDRIYELEKVDK